MLSSETDGVPWMEIEACVVFDTSLNLSEPVSPVKERAHFPPGLCEAT